MIDNRDLMFEPGWYAAYVTPRYEAKVADAVKALGCEVYLACETVWRRHARKRDRVQRPLILRYVFVRLEHDGAGFHHLRAVRGVESIVGIIGRPSRIPSSIVDRLRKEEAAGAFDLTLEKPWPPADGDTVRITEGPFTGIEAKVSFARKDAKKIKILLDKMQCGYGGELTISIDKLEAA